MATFQQVADRKKLKPRRDPYWAKVSKGCYLGFRRMSARSDGTWLARCLDDTTGKQAYKPLGDFPELPDHQRFDAAKKAAQAWFEHIGKGGSVQVMTVAEVCKKYVAHLRDTKGDTPADDAEARFARHVLPNKRLAATEVTKLLPAHIEAWRKSLKDTVTVTGTRKGERRTDSSLNRDMNSFRAALNLAFHDGLTTSNFAWKTKLQPVKNADRKRDVYLDLGQRRNLINHAPESLANFLRGMSLIPLRPGAVAALKVSSYDKRLKTLTIGKDKAGADRKIALPDTTATFFADLCKDKLPSASLFCQASGAAWDKESWRRPFKAAALAAGLPAAATTYAIRHSTITDLIHSGLDSLTVAQLSGTSIAMIEKHYGHLTREHAREGLARLVL